MYSDKKNIQELVALLEAHKVRKIVLCPGSRNAPIVQTIVNHSYFSCTSVTDERSAAYIALGLALNGGEPVAVCCTSGTALLNMHPAVAEAYYQQVPLVVISADRPEAWIGQMDGQTIPQPNAFGKLVKSSVNLPEVKSDEDKWYCNRLINEALLELYHHGRGPVHINVPISEPLFNFNTTELPSVRVITRYEGLNMYNREYDDLIEKLNGYSKRMMIAGQQMMIYMFEKRTGKALQRNFVWLSEYLSNKTTPGQSITNFDALLYTLEEKELPRYQPELIITYGGHVVSKRLKNFLRKYPPKEHWHVSADGEVVDLFGSLTTIIEISPFEFLDRIAPYLLDVKPDYTQLWESKSKTIKEPELTYSSCGVIGQLMKTMSTPSVLHLANSSAVRYAQLFKLLPDVDLCCNRGTNGIEGSLSTAIGYSLASDKLNYVVIGDLSFFYDMNAIWSANYGSNLRILLLNNGGGEIFKALRMNLTGKSEKYVRATHATKAEGWAKERGFEYLSAQNQEELDQVLSAFNDPNINQTKPMFLEVFTDTDKDVADYISYYHSLKNK
ncbi:2-succinyl-5-enolpyruvyl-6-hydroxy-3-cyclohexene -1-carboxylatesynthase [Bacteroides coprosuis DSM 18011]|uniref:2-succinyl-5-enolpyruvyl-6-hydroxy-3-cyclohexene-1-carboxylate synthase n=1 Tax=Bacteroides coprosuis DSM 18011 TaxID=679937 RepID=F3ZPG0_9BACE|nr:2-succinyl-5-enolpyruvyl-6-hydroxy-3-cyclohexene-1-carboxylic-acid synthase [Bacteroides coprosuis]EGJ71617.1 2-succinyl-5-enolpyruvyl-6-hydroxy-3-cyclohexene -1-carboxylatesynthase [Bacteroides coprosuis DSM 18011]